MPRGRKPGLKNKVNIVNNGDGSITVTDPVLAASMSRASFCEGSSSEVPFPDNWDKMGKIERLKWLTANKKQ